MSADSPAEMCRTLAPESQFNNSSLARVSLIRRVSARCIGQAYQEVELLKPHPAVEIRTPQQPRRNPALKVLHAKDLKAFRKLPLISSNYFMNRVREEVPSAAISSEFTVHDVSVMSIRDGAHFVMLDPTKESFATRDDERCRLRRVAVKVLDEQPGSEGLKLDWICPVNGIDITAAYVPAGLPASVLDQTVELIACYTPRNIQLDPLTKV